jgi:hypothetical protein
MTYILKTLAERDCLIYSLAKEFLPSLKISGVDDELIAHYLKPAPIDPQVTTKRELYQRILESAQNANMKAGVIGKAIGGVYKLAPVLSDFDPDVVLWKYGNDWEVLLNDIVKEVKPRGKVRQTPKSIWPSYCQTILSAAAFLEQFSTAKEFFKWADFFDGNDAARAGLPMLISCEIKGFGFTLSCDFLKELGYTNFPKPDVHLKDIFSELDLIQADKSPYHLFKTIVRVARNADVSAYNADKVFWLIGSGNFYDHKLIGNNGMIGSHKKQFIASAKRKLAEM